MSLLSPVLLERLGRSRLLTTFAMPVTGVGERRSRTTGSGMEFADHRPYQAGDDIRHIDRHVYARLGQYHLRRFSTYQQLVVTILIDTSRSMAFGEPRKHDLARSVAAGLAYVGLAGGDLVQVGALVNGGVRWHPRLQGARRIDSVVAWLTEVQPIGDTDLRRALAAAVPRLAFPGTTIVISDFFCDDLTNALGVLRQASQEVVAVQVLAPQETDPGLAYGGEALFVDSETGHEVETSVDVVQLDRYKHELALWMEELRGLVTAVAGRHWLVSSDASVDALFLTRWRQEGLIR
jgi:uncharacterized protein (DUF58 family)